MYAVILIINIVHIHIFSLCRCTDSSTLPDKVTYNVKHVAHALVSNLYHICCLIGRSTKVSCHVGKVFLLAFLSVFSKPYGKVSGDNGV